MTHWRFLLAALGLAALPALASAGPFGWSIGVNVGGPVYPRPYYYSPYRYYYPPPVYVRPAPVYVQPAPVYVQPAPVVYSVPNAPAPAPAPALAPAPTPTSLIQANHPGDGQRCQQLLDQLRS